MKTFYCVTLSQSYNELGENVFIGKYEYDRFRSTYIIFMGLKCFRLK